MIIHDGSNPSDVPFSNGDGDIVVGYAGSAGASADGSEDMLVGSGDTVAMLTANGDEDTAFAGSGQVTIGDADIFAVVPRPDGEILVGYVDGGGECYLTELTAGGSVDASFGSGGTVDLGDSGAATSEAQAVCVRPDGEILVAGATGGDQVTLTLLTADGSVDPSFGTGGTSTADLNGGQYEYVVAVLVEPAGGILVEAADLNSNETAELIRFSADGTWDTSFGTSGVATAGPVAPDPSGDGNINGQNAAVAVSADGDVLVAGFDWATGNVAVARLSAGGQLDPTFGHDGVAEATAHDGDTTVVGIDVTADGRVLVGCGPDYGGSAAFALVGFTASGTLDRSFGTAGVLAGATVDSTLGMVVQPSGKVVMIGGTGEGNQEVLTLERFDPDALGRRLYAEQDADDNVTSLSNSSGSIVERYAYNPYGAVTVENPDGSVRGDGTASASYYGSVYLYQGMRLDVVTGTYDGKRRVYDVSLDRWLQPDPAGYVDGPDTYQFVGGNPVDRADPSGEFWGQVVGWGGIVAVEILGGGPEDPFADAAAAGIAAETGIITIGADQYVVAGLLGTAAAQSGPLQATAGAQQQAQPSGNDNGQGFGASGGGESFDPTDDHGQAADVAGGGSFADPGAGSFADPDPLAAAATEAANAGGYAEAIAEAAAAAAGASPGEQTGAAETTPEQSQIAKNKAQGDAFEAQVLAAEIEAASNSKPQITIVTASGVKTRVDTIGNDDQTGAVRITEAKSSETAPLTGNQAKAFPEIGQSGGTIVGKGKPPFIGGTKIPPTKVNVVRPK